MSTFARVFLERYNGELAAEQMEAMAVWEEELCKPSAADREAASTARAAALVGVQDFFAKFAFEIAELQKQTLRDVVMSNQAHSYAECGCVHRFIFASLSFADSRTKRFVGRLGAGALRRVSGFSAPLRSSHL